MELLMPRRDTSIYALVIRATCSASCVRRASSVAGCRQPRDSASYLRTKNLRTDLRLQLTIDADRFKWYRNIDFWNAQMFFCLTSSRSSSQEVSRSSLRNSLRSLNRAASLARPITFDCAITLTQRSFPQIWLDIGSSSRGSTFL